jgi:hypothetical protein
LRDGIFVQVSEVRVVIVCLESFCLETTGLGDSPGRRLNHESVSHRSEGTDCKDIGIDLHGLQVFEFDKLCLYLNVFSFLVDLLSPKKLRLKNKYRSVEVLRPFLYVVPVSMCHFPVPSFPPNVEFSN